MATERMQTEDANFEYGERSRLYAIPPTGLDGRREGLLSYLIRLSAEHMVRPRDLIRYEIAPDTLTSLHGMRQPGFNHQYALTVNGLGHYAEHLVDRLHQLTGRNDLRTHTLLPLRELFASNGPGLMSPRRKWCPACLADHGGTPFAPLVWSLQAYEICATHDVPLDDKCPACQRPQPFIPKLPILSACVYCSRPLGCSIENVPKPEQDTVPTWTSRALESLVAFSAKWQGEGLLKRFHSRLQTFIDNRTNGNRAAFTREVGFGVGAFKNWFTKGERPTLAQFLKLGFALDIMPAELLDEETPMPVSWRGSVSQIEGHATRSRTYDESHLTRRMWQFSRHAPVNRQNRFRGYAHELALRDTRSAIGFRPNTRLSASDGHRHRRKA